MVTTFHRILPGLWLLISTIFLGAFSGQLRMQILRPKPIYWIDSWDDLYEWKHLNIQVSFYSEIKLFVNNFPDHPYAQDFGKRLQLKEVNEYDKDSNDADGGDSWNFDIEGVKSGKVAVSYPATTLEIIKKKYISEDFKEDIHFHISRTGISQPYFNVIIKFNLDESIAKTYDLV